VFSRAGHCRSDIVACLRAAPADTLLNASVAVGATAMIFNPAIDGYALSGDVRAQTDLCCCSPASRLCCSTVLH
jgi:hypothetical protein